MLEEGTLLCYRTVGFEIGLYFFIVKVLPYSNDVYGQEAGLEKIHSNNLC